MYDDQNIFAKILRGELSADKIYEDEHVLAFNDIFPAARIHILVIPKGSYTSFHDFIEHASEKEIGHFFKAVSSITKKLDLGEGYRIVSNVGGFGMQTVPHMHLHIIGGEQLKSMHK